MKITLTEAIQKLRTGEVIAIPTETVYGLAARYDDPQAVAKIFALKGRPETKPLSLLFATLAQVQNLILSGHATLAKLSRFWPGPLTVIVPARTEAIPDSVRAGGDSIGLRMPDQALTLELLRQTGPLAAPSANPSALPAAVSAGEVENYFGEDFPVLDGGPCSIGAASTVIRLHDQGFAILREGPITKEQIQNALRKGVLK